MLGVPETVSPRELTLAFRRLAKIYHEKSKRFENGFVDPWPPRIMRMINESYEILSNPEKRAEYNRSLVLARAGAQRQPTTRTEPVERIPFLDPDYILDLATGKLKKWLHKNKK